MITDIYILWQERLPIMYAVAPHGVIAESVVLGFVCSARFRHVVPVGSSVMFKLPIVRDFCGWAGMCEANETCIRKQLSQGRDVVIVPEGIRGFVLEDTPEAIPVRTGFIRCAMREGAQIIPVHVPETKCMYTRWNFPWMQPFRRWTLDCFGYAPSFVTGWAGGPFPFCATSQGIKLCFGRPIDTWGRREEDILDLYQRQMKELRQFRGN